MAPCSVGIRGHYSLAAQLTQEGDAFVNATLSLFENLSPQSRQSWSLFLVCILKVLSEHPHFPELTHLQACQFFLNQASHSIVTRPALSPVCHPASHPNYLLLLYGAPAVSPCTTPRHRNITWATVSNLSTVKNLIKRYAVFKRRAEITHSNMRTLHTLPPVSLFRHLLCLWAQASSSQARLSLNWACFSLWTQVQASRSLSSEVPPPPQPSRALSWHLISVSLVIFICGVKTLSRGSNPINCMIWS